MKRYAYVHVYIKTMYTCTNYFGASPCIYYMYFHHYCICSMYVYISNDHMHNA